MPGGDMVYTGVYDGSQVAKGLVTERRTIDSHQRATDRVRDNALRQEKRRAALMQDVMASSFGVRGTTLARGGIPALITAGVYKFHKDGVEEYAKRNSEFAARLQEPKRAWSDFMAAVGRSTAAVVGGFSRSMAETIRSGEKAYDSFYRRYQSGYGDTVDATKADDAMRSDFTSRVITGRELRRSTIDQARRRGDDVGAARLEAAAWLDERKQQIQAMERLTESDRAALVADAQAEARARVESAEYKQRAEENRAKGEERERVRKEQLLERERFDRRKGDTFSADGQRRLENEGWNIGVEEERLRIQTLRLRGEDQAADRAEVELRYAEKIRDVRREILEDAMAFNGEEESIVGRLVAMKDAELGLLSMTPGRGGGAARAGSTLPYDSAIYGNLQLGSSGGGASVESNVATMTGMMKAVKSTLERIAARPVIGGWQ